MKKKKGYDVYIQSFKEGFKPDPKLLVSDWADKYRVLPRESSAEPGRFRTDRTPYTREIMDALSVHNPTREVTWVKATQISGTETGNNWFFSIAHMTPGPCLMVLPTIELAEYHSKNKIAPSLAVMDCLTGIVSEPKSRTSGNTLLMKQFPGGFWRFAGSNSEASLRSASIRFLFLDDIDGYPQDVDGKGDPVELAKKRTDAFASMRKIFYCSTPTIKGLSRIEKQYEVSDKSLYHVPCPICGKYQSLDWGGKGAKFGIKWEKDKKTGDYLPGSARYKCKHCHKLIEEKHKTEMLAKGKWIASVPSRSKYHRGFKLSSLYAPIGWVSWEQIVREFLEAKNTPEKLKVWTNTRLAETWDDSGSQPDWTIIKQRAEPYEIFDIPSKVLILSAGIDTQDDRLAVVVKGWGRGEESWLIWWGEIFGRPDEALTWKELDAILYHKKYIHPSGVAMQIACAAIDTGGHFTHDVYNYVRVRNPKVIAVKGQSIENKPILGRPTMQDVNYKGTVIKNGVQLWPVGSDTGKTRVYARLKIKEPGPGRMHFPFGLDDDYYLQLTAEKIVKRYSKGHPKWEWTLPSGSRNEALDCEIYAMAAAIRAGITRVDWGRLEDSFGVPRGEVANCDIESPVSVPKKPRKKRMRVRSKV